MEDTKTQDFPAYPVKKLSENTVEELKAKLELNDRIWGDKGAEVVAYEQIKARLLKELDRRAKVEAK